MTNTTKPSFYLYDAPTGIRCCVYAPSKSFAAKKLCTTTITLGRRSKIFEKIGDALKGYQPGMKRAQASPGAVFIQLPTGDWEPLSADNSSAIITAAQAAARGCQHAMIGDAPMKIGTIRASKETWAQYAALGGAKWFRKRVKEEFQKLKGQDAD